MSEAHVPVLLWRRELSGRVSARGGALAVCDGSVLTVLDSTGRVAFREDAGSQPMGVSLRGEGSMDGHVLTPEGLRAFTRKGLLRPVPAPKGAMRLLDEDAGRLLFQSRGGVIVAASDGLGQPVEIRGEFLAGRLGPSLVLLSDRLEMRSASGAEELALDGDWVLLLGDEPYAMGESVVRAGSGAFVASFDRHGDWLGGATFDAGMLFWDGDGGMGLVSKAGAELWRGTLPGRVVAAEASGPVMADGRSLAQYRFVPEGRTLVFEMLCQNRARCGTFVSLEHRARCPSCGGEDISVRHAEVDSSVTEG